MNAPVKAGERARKRILSAAKTCFAEYGFLAASTRDIAEMAGVAQGLLRYHFDTKEALWRAVMDDIFAYMASAYPIAEMEPERTTRETLEVFIMDFITFSEDEPALYPLMTHESRSPSQRQNWLLETHVRPYFEAVQSLLEEGQRERIVRHTDPVLLYYAIIGIVGAAYSYGPEISILRRGHSIQDKEKLRALISDLIFI